MKDSGPSKFKHFLWQVVYGFLALNSKLRSLGLDCDIQFQRCGSAEETINHDFLNVLQHYKLGVYRKYLQFQVFPSTSV